MLMTWYRDHVSSQIFCMRTQSEEHDKGTIKYGSTQWPILYMSKSSSYGYLCVIYSGVN